MELYNIFKHILRWGDTQYTVSLSDIKRYCEYLGSQVSNSSIKQALDNLKLEGEIENFTMRVKELIITK